jgi:hypothetical protein
MEPVPVKPDVATAWANEVKQPRGLLGQLLLVRAGDVVRGEHRLAEQSAACLGACHSESSPMPRSVVEVVLKIQQRTLRTKKRR